MPGRRATPLKILARARTLATHRDDHALLPLPVLALLIGVHVKTGCLRLVRALCAETHEGWLEDHRYLNMEFLKEQKKELRTAA